MKEKGIVEQEKEFEKDLYGTYTFLIKPEDMENTVKVQRKIRPKLNEYVEQHTIGEEAFFKDYTNTRNSAEKLITITEMQTQEPTVTIKEHK